MLGFVCFMCPGLFNALNGLGGGGQVNPKTNSTANATVYATFAFAAFFAGYVFEAELQKRSELFFYSSVNNKLGSRLTLLLGSFGYALYIGSYL
jgi:hypothetical protein